MSEKFDWQADDDAVWDSLSADKINSKHAGPRRRWPWFILIAVFFAAAATMLWYQIDRRADENTDAMRADIISSHNIIQIAEAEQDDELFFSVLSGRNSDWTAAQNELFQSGLLFDRTPFGLSPLPEGRAPLTETDESVTIDFSADHQTAEVSTENPYSINIGNGLTETITLRDTMTYRLGHERWLLAPPESDFWGSQGSLQGARLQFSFQQRDAEIISRMLPDLERKLEEMCAILSSLKCPGNVPIQIRFSTDPSVLAATALPLEPTGSAGNLQIELPTPTLVGLPDDEAGYQALYRGYAAQLATAMITYLVGYDCCDQLPFYEAIVDYELGQLSLKPWPVSDSDYERILDERVQLADLSDSWTFEGAAELSEDEGWLLYVALDFLLSSVGDLDTVTMQRELSQHESFLQWLSSLSIPQDGLPDATAHSDLMRRFWLQAYPRAMQTTEQVSTWHEQDLVITCSRIDPNNEDVQIATLFRYDLSQDAWSPEFDTRNFLFVKATADDDALLLQEFSFDNNGWLSSVWQNEQSQSILQNTDEYSISFGQFDPTGSGLLAFVFPPDGSEATVTQFDLDNCGANGCDNRPLPGIPIWSPDGRQLLFTDEPNIQLALLQSDHRTIQLDSSAEIVPLRLYYVLREQIMEGEPVTAVAELTAVGEGHAPFWLDNETIGYVSVSGDRLGQEVVIQEVGRDVPRTLFTMQDIIAALPKPTTAAEDFWIHYVMVHPTESNLLLAAVVNDTNQEVSILSFQRDTGELRHLMDAERGAHHSLGFSPDGRYQVLTGQEVNDPDSNHKNSLLLLHDLESNETIPFLTLGPDFAPVPSYDWSKDGKWIAMMLDHDRVGLYEPGKQSLRILETASANCASPVWINQNS